MMHGIKLLKCSCFFFFRKGEGAWKAVEPSRSHIFDSHKPTPHVIFCTLCWLNCWMNSCPVKKFGHTALLLWHPVLFRSLMELSISTDVTAEWFLTNEGFHNGHVSCLETAMKKKEWAIRWQRYVVDLKQLQPCVLEVLESNSLQYVKPVMIQN